MQQRGFMKTTSLNVVGKLPQGLVELYQIISRHTGALGIPYLVVGATAYLFGVESGRRNATQHTFNTK